MSAQREPPPPARNPAYDPATDEWVLDRGHSDPVFVRRRTTDPKRPRGRAARAPRPRAKQPPLTA